MHPICTYITYHKNSFKLFTKFENHEMEHQNCAVIANFVSFLYTNMTVLNGIVHNHKQKDETHI